MIAPTEDTTQVSAPGAALDLGLVLIGRGIDFLPHFIGTLRALGAQGLGFRVDLHDDRCCVPWQATDMVPSPIREGDALSSDKVDRILLYRATLMAAALSA